MTEKKKKRAIKLSEDFFPAPETVHRLVGGSRQGAADSATPSAAHVPRVVAGAVAGSRRPTTEAEAMEIILPAPRSRRQETSKVSPAGRRAIRPAAGDKSQPPGHSTATRAHRTAEKPGDARAGLLGPLPAVFSLALGMTLFVIQSMALPWRVLFARDREDRRG